MVRNDGGRICRSTFSVRCWGRYMHKEGKRRPKTNPLLSAGTKITRQSSRKTGLDHVIGTFFKTQVISNQSRPNSLCPWNPHLPSQIWHVRMRVGCPEERPIGRESKQPAGGERVSPPCLSRLRLGWGLSSGEGQLCEKRAWAALLCSLGSACCWVRGERTPCCVHSDLYLRKPPLHKTVCQCPWAFSLVIIYSSLEEIVGAEVAGWGGVGNEVWQSVLPLETDIQDSKTPSAFGELPFWNTLELLIPCYN